MHYIVAGILSLVQHRATCETSPEVFRPPACPRCGNSNGMQCHGHYTRKADRERYGPDSLNPVVILRFFCPSCRSACSVLPECIPPRRHYLWQVQEAVLLDFVKQFSYQAISQKHKPSRWTISRWMRGLASHYAVLADQLRSLMPSLGRLTTFAGFWLTLLDSHALSRVMLYVHHAGVMIPC